MADTSAPLEEFESRLSTIGLMFELLEQLETGSDALSTKMQAAVVSTGIQIQFYAAVEQAIRMVLEETHQVIAQHRPRIQELTEFWRQKAIEDLVLSDLRGGTKFDNHLEKIAEALVPTGRLMRPQFTGRRLPFAGNVKVERLQILFGKLRIEFRPPPEARGGSDLDGLWTARNDAAHGEVRFERAGKASRDLRSEFERMEVFVRWLIAEVADYAANERFREAV